MPNDLIDRRPTRAAGCEDIDADADDRRGAARGVVWGALGFEVGPGSGSPGLSDHAAAEALIGAAVGRVVGLIERPISRRTTRYATAAGEVVRVVESPSNSRRDGASQDPTRHVHAYFLRAVAGLSLAEIGRRLGVSRSSAQYSVKAGAALVGRFARARTDPRRPSPGGRPVGRNERPW
jgi:hypothetical protein